MVEEVNRKMMLGKEPKTKVQIKNKIDSLKKSFRQERDGARQTGSTPSK